MSLAKPKVGFVSLGCPKALVDSERILTQLRVEGYDIVQSYDAADVVVVNTCGFIDSAVTESLDAIGEAIAENGKVIVTGCLGKRPSSDPRRAPGRAVDQRPAGLRQRDERGARRVAADARPVHQPGTASAAEIDARHRHQADAEALRLPEDFRRLQPPLQLLHHPVDARRPGVAPGRRGAARGREARDGRRQGTAGDLAGHLGLRRRRQVRRARMARQGLPDAHEGAVRGPGRAGPVDAPALRLPVPARRRDHPADGADRANGMPRCCRTSTSRSSTPARACSS